ncbi:unnamed protein product [Caenorhabditis auriculariae]|uniref:MATH domain-containing protein n=1 Tax=Caenorhabditis auriculariae TaxID=2777116 RepID=A0A8S1GUV6_9PELO|nr:unnamed protein product [Caenorhabditis auriculariae]
MPFQGLLCHVRPVGHSYQTTVQVRLVGQYGKAAILPPYTIQPNQRGTAQQTQQMAAIEEVEEGAPGGSSAGGAGDTSNGVDARESEQGPPQYDFGGPSGRAMSLECHPNASMNRRFAGGRMNLCILHQGAGQPSHRPIRKIVTSVACQTDDDEEFGPITPFAQSNDGASCSDGVLRLMIQNFRNMGDTVRGPSKRIQGVCWRIMVMPRQHVVQKKGTQKCLGFFLQCCPEAYSEYVLDAWSCQASAELRLISQKAGVPHFTRKTNHIYTAKENDWGYSCFMTWADILDESQGYIKDDRVVLEVTVKADPPKNILTLEDFRKSIQNWYDLADMQYHRGCIDLAIEANAQAIKFCKEKDPECQTRLMEQKNFFIDMKLVESIHRIEKVCGKEAKKEEDGSSNQNAVRLALTANTSKSNKKDKNKKNMKNKKGRAATPSTQEQQKQQLQQHLQHQQQLQQKVHQQQLLQKQKLEKLQQQHQQVQKLKNARIISEVKTEKANSVQNSAGIAGKAVKIIAKASPASPPPAKKAALEKKGKNEKESDAKEKEKDQKNEKKKESDKSDKPEKNEKNDKNDKNEKDEKKGGNDKSGKDDKKDKDDKGDKKDQKDKDEKSDKNDKKEKKEKKDKKNKKNAGCSTSTEPTASSSSPVVGFYNPKLFGEEGIVTWAKRSKQEDEMYSRVVNTMQSDFAQPDLTPAERDSFVMRYMTEQMKHLYIHDKENNKKRNWYSMHQLRQFAENAFEVELQRQFIIKTATQHAREYMNKAIAKGEKVSGTYEKVEWDVSLLFDSNKKDERIKIIDREAGFLDAKIRLFWDALGGMDAFLESDESDRESVSSRDSHDRQNDGCIKAKRSKIEHTCDSCLKEAYCSYPYMCDSECQTEPVQKPVADIVALKDPLVVSIPPTPPLPPAPQEQAQPVPNRPVKKANKKNKKEDASTLVNGQAQTETAVQVVPTADIPVVEAGAGSSSSLEIVTIDSPTGSMQAGQNWDPNDEHSQAMNALALHCAYYRQLVAKFEELMHTISKNSCDPAARSTLRLVSVLAGNAYVENDEKFYLEPLFIPEPYTTDPNPANFYSRVLQIQNREMAITNMLNERIEACREYIQKYLFFDRDDTERMVSGIRRIEESMKLMTLRHADMKKDAEEADRRTKKMEKQLRDENKNLKNQWTNEKEKSSTLNKELKEKTRSAKNAENRISNLTSEKDELVEKQKQMQKELSTVQKKLNDETQKAKREIHQLTETKKVLQGEISLRDADLKNHVAQAEEHTALLKKFKDELNTEKNKNNQLQQNLTNANERARKSELQMLTVQENCGSIIFEQHIQEAMRTSQELEDMANEKNGDRGRSESEIAAAKASREEWIKFTEDLNTILTTFKSSHEKYIESLKAGKTISSLPRLTIPEVPPAPQKLTLPPIPPPEPAKPSPGVIGTRPGGHTTRNMSPNNAASRSPNTAQNGPILQGNNLQKQVHPSPPMPSNNSPSRHGPIGSRPRRGTPNGNGETPSSSMNVAPTQSLGSLWSENVTPNAEPFTSNKRYVNNDYLGATDLGSGLFGSTWSDDSPWGPSLIPNGIASSSIGQNSNINNLNTVLTSSSGLNNSYNGAPNVTTSNSYMNPLSTNFTNSSSTWGMTSDIQRQLLMRQHEHQRQHFQQTVTALSKKMSMDIDKCAEIVQDFCRDHKITSYNLTADDATVDRLREHYAKRIATMRMSAPPGAAPGYSVNPLMNSFMMERQMTPTFNYLEHSINDRPSLGNEKWSNGI